MRSLLLAACLFFFCAINAQEIKGKVLSEKGFGAAAVTIAFKNKANTVITKKDGTFSIIAKKLPDTLVFSAAGFEPYTVVVTEKTIKDPNFEVVLLNKRSAMEEVVVTTAYSSARRDVAYSELPMTDLSGKVSGKPRHMSIPRSTSAPGYSGSKKLFMYDSIIFKKDTVVYRSGLLSAGEINDFNKWKMWEDFADTEFKVYSEQWGVFAKKRYCVQIQNKEHKALVNQPVYLINAITKDTAWKAFTDNTGKAELWAGFNGKENEGTQYIIASKDYESIKAPGSFENGVNKMVFKSSCTVSNKVEMAFVVDATGSMGDEIEFLKLELEDVIRKTFESYTDLDLKVGSVFYRDRGDEYLTRTIDFQTDLLKVLNFIKLQSAGGGGDTPEAVDDALQSALDSLSWTTDAKSRILFLILDAPPHGYAKDKIYRQIMQAAAKGIRIVPIVCSGADKGTEFLMRTMALATNGTYVFLTDNSGVGLPHIKPTTDAFSVELFNSLLQRIIKQMVFTAACENNSIVSIDPKNIPGIIEKVKIFPNPTQGEVKIESTKDLKQIFVTDFTGKIIMSLKPGKMQKQWKTNIASYPSGTYLVKYITSDDQWGAEKVVLIH